MEIDGAEKVVGGTEVEAGWSFDLGFKILEGGLAGGFGAASEDAFEADRAWLEGEGCERC